MLNPAQPFQLNRGKLFLDLDPSCISTWLAPFVNCWSDFVLRNPSTIIDNLYVSASAVYYGSPTDNAVSHQLHGYAGVPLILSYFRDKISAIWSKLLNIGAMRKTDQNAHVPSGNFNCLLYIYNSYFVDCEEVNKFLIGRAFDKNQYIMMNTDPDCSFNRLMGHLVLAFWEYVTCLNYARVPKDPTVPLSGSPWFLHDFIPTTVSPSGTSRSVPLL